MDTLIQASGINYQKMIWGLITTILLPVVVIVLALIKEYQPISAVFEVSLLGLIFAIPSLPLIFIFAKNTDIESKKASLKKIFKRTFLIFLIPAALLLLVLISGSDGGGLATAAVTFYAVIIFGILGIKTIFWTKLSSLEDTNQLFIVRASAIFLILVYILQGSRLALQG